MMRAVSGPSLQTCRESRNAAIQAVECVKDGDEPLHLCRLEKEEGRQGYRRRNASVGRSEGIATCERGRPHQRW